MNLRVSSKLSLVTRTEGLHGSSDLSHADTSTEASGDYLNTCSSEAEMMRHFGAWLTAI